jgi:hypothetical protein
LVAFAAAAEGSAHQGFASIRPSIRSKSLVLRVNNVFVLGFASLQPDACAVGYVQNGACVVGLLYNQINFALAQHPLKQGEHMDFSGKWLGGGVWRGAHQQVYVAAFFGIIHARPKEPHGRTRAKRGVGGVEYGLDLISVEAHRKRGR